jgi:serine phosphatase RsbU (regulator of sigma subunit)
LAFVRKHWRLPIERLLDAILEDVQRFSASKEFADDVCLVAVKRHPRPTAESMSP